MTGLFVDAGIRAVQPPFLGYPPTHPAPLGTRLRRLRLRKEAPMSASSRAFNEVTARPVTTKVGEFIADLLEHFQDDERVAEAIRAEGPKGEYGRLLGRVRDRLAREDAIEERRRVPQVHLEGVELLAVVRGQASPPDPPFTFDSRGLKPDEYGEVIAWSTKRLEARSR